MNTDPMVSAVLEKLTEVRASLEALHEMGHGIASREIEAPAENLQALALRAALLALVDGLERECEALGELDLLTSALVAGVSTTVRLVSAEQAH